MFKLKVNVLGVYFFPSYVNVWRTIHLPTFNNVCKILYTVKLVISLYFLTCWTVFSDISISFWKNSTDRIVWNFNSFPHIVELSSLYCSFKPLRHTFRSCFSYLIVFWVSVLLEKAYVWNYFIEQNWVGAKRQKWENTSCTCQEPQTRWHR